MEKKKVLLVASAFENSEFGRTHGKKQQNSEIRKKHAQFHLAVARRKVLRRLPANRRVDLLEELVSQKIVSAQFTGLRILWFLGVLADQKAF